MGSQEGRKTGVGVEKAFGFAVMAMVATTVVVALYFAGSPAKERSRRIDTQRVNDIQAIAYSIDSFYANTARVPKGLEELNDAATGRYHSGSLVDPVTKAQYEYRQSNNSAYEICATFDMTSEEVSKDPERSYPMPYPVGDPTWNHGAGYHCFSVDSALRQPRSVCSLTSPCAAGQSCVTIGDGKGAVCVPEGKECIVAGCMIDKCIIAESYPAQVRCME